MTKKSQQKKREEDKYFDDSINEHLRILKQDEEKKKQDEEDLALKRRFGYGNELKKLMDYFIIFELFDEKITFYNLLRLIIKESLNKILKENENCNGSELIQKIRDCAFFCTPRFNKDDGRETEILIRGDFKKFSTFDLFNKFYKLFFECNFLEDMVSYVYDDYKEDETLYVLK
jgi:hypothetical protein